MGLKVLEAEFDLLIAKAEEADLLDEFYDYLRETYDLWEFEQALSQELKYGRNANGTTNPL